jgi:protein TonB
MQGTVVLRLSLSRAGQLLSVGVSKSSGEDTLDSAALSAVRMTGTFPSAPVEVTGDQVTLELPFVFRLK